MDRYTHAQSHITHTSREPCTNCTSSIAHPLEQNAQEAESYTHGQVHTCSIAHPCEYRAHTSREPCTNSTSSITHPLEQNTQEAESYTHGQVHTCSIAQAESHAPIVQTQLHTHLNKTLKGQRAIHMDRYHTHTSREQHASVIQAQSHTRLKTLLKR